MSKAASLIADSYDTQIIFVALSEGIPTIVSDETIIDPARYFPAGIARKVESLKHELESYGVRFQRSSVSVRPEHKCTSCVGDSCKTCAPSNTSANSASVVSSAPSAVVKASPSSAGTSQKSSCGSCLRENCKNPYGSCASNCPESVKQILKAGAARIEKGNTAALPSEELARMIDHTMLKPDASPDEITKLCEEARANNFASVCVNPAHVPLCAKLLQSSPVKVCTVIGFPLGATSTYVKVAETRDVIANGANEVDMVINIGALKGKDYELVRNDIARVVEAASGKIVKVILETSLLNNEEKVKACELAKQAGADFVKTSTGFSTGGATVEDIALMRQTVGEKMGVKASGGIRDRETADRMVAAGATRIGASASVAIVKGMPAVATKGY
ncbi:MAG: deoxyribose-phosphate aldolase [Candidatus Riflebacteria bacterium]|nr:deoxyribose-phosphate aldolase [Candidatus Riflebacteria bacterium]